MFLWIVLPKQIFDMKGKLEYIKCKLVTSISIIYLQMLSYMLSK